MHRFLRSDVVKRVFLGVDLFSIILFQKCFFPHLMYFLFVLPCQVVMDNKASFKATRTVIHEQLKQNFTNISRMGHSQLISALIHDDEGNERFPIEMKQFIVN